MATMQNSSVQHNNQQYRGVHLATRSKPPYWAQTLYSLFLRALSILVYTYNIHIVHVFRLSRAMSGDTLH